MAEGPGAASSTVSYGLQLATTLQVYAEGLSEAKEKIRDLAVDISTTASALIQLQDTIIADQTRFSSQNGTRVFKDEGLKEIENVVTQCAKIYATIVIVVTKAGTSASKGKTAASFGEMPVLKAASLLRTLRWAWLEPRIKRIEEQLRWLKLKVLLNLQLAGLAKFQLGIPERAPGSFDEELALRAMAHRIRRREVKYLEKLSTKYRAKEMLGVDSPFTASNISIPLPIPDIAPTMPMPNIRPAFVSEVPKDVPSPNHFPDARIVAETDKKQVISPEKAFPERVQEVKEEPVKPTMPSPKPVSSTSRSDTMVQDQHSAKEAAVVKDDIKIIEVEDTKPGESSTTKAPAQTKESPNTEDDKSREETADSKQPVDKAPAISSLPGFESRHSIFPSWIKGMFGQSNKVSNDWQSQTLEAYIIPEDSKTLLKAPLGHQTLSQGLKKMKRQCLAWDQYTALGSQHHNRINQAVLEAKRLDSRERTCVAVGLNKEFGSERIMLFFLVGAPVEPIHLKDAVGRKFSFPWEQSRTWPMMKSLIDQAFLHVEIIGSHVNEGHYDLLNEEGKIILPEVFDTMVSPGCKITQHMWPMPTPPNKRPPGGLPGPPGPPQGHFGPPPGARPPGLFSGGLPAIVNHGPPGPPPGHEPARGVLGWMAGNHGHGTDDSSVLVSDSDIEDEPEDLGLEIDFDKEEENAKLNLGELLAKFTNATDTVHDVFSDDEDSSDDDSDGSSSLVSD